MINNWTKVEQEVPLSDVNILVLDDEERMFLCKYNQSTYSYALRVLIDSVFIEVRISNVKFWRYAPEPPKQ